MQRARALYLVEFTANLRHPVADHASVGLDLRFARTAEEAEATALPLEVGPAPHQPARLIFEVCKLNLKLPLCSRRALAEDFEDEAGSVDHLGADFLFQILLLDGRQRGIDDQQARALLLCALGNLFNLPLAEKRRRARRAHPKRPRRHDLNSDRFGQTLRLLDARVG
jgi:hypothetical protein